jgi:DNA polymerase-1
VPYEAVTTTLRRNAKAVNFGIVYGISPYGLSQDLNIPVKEAANYIEQYFEKYPKVKSFLDKTVSDAKERGYTTTMYDRVRPIPELSSSNFMQRAFGERIAMNTPIQGSAADIMKVAMINVYKRLDAEKLDANLILQVHDELVIEVKEALSLQVQQLLIEEMEQATHISVPLTVDAHIGKNWYDAK